MRFRSTSPLINLLTGLLVLSPPVTAGPHPALSQQAGFSFNELFARWDCGGQVCGYDSKYCCTAGSVCYTNAQTIALCTAAAEGSWQYWTTTYTQTDLQTITSVMSSYVGPTSVAAATTMTCNVAANEKSCGGTCCKSDEYCFSAANSQCEPAANGASSGLPTGYPSPTPTATESQTPGSPILPTSHSTLVVTETRSATTSTVPFETPVATGANITITSDQATGHHLSGGAIAGIVIGVLIGLGLLGLICFYCCIKGLLDGLLALFGLGKKKRRTTEIDEYERRSHHSHAGGGRTWYGAAKPARVERREKSHEGRNLLGLGAGLAALWAVLGLKRRRDHRKEEEYSEYSYGSSYYDTSASSASSDRRTRDTRRTRSQSRYSRR